MRFVCTLIFFWYSCFSHYFSFIVQRCTIVLKHIDATCPLVLKLNIQSTAVRSTNYNSQSKLTSTHTHATRHTRTQIYRFNFSNLGDSWQTKGVHTQTSRQINYWGDRMHLIERKNYTSFDWNVTELLPDRFRMLRVGNEVFHIAKRVTAFLRKWGQHQRKPSNKLFTVHSSTSERLAHNSFPPCCVLPDSLCVRRAYGNITFTDRSRDVMHRESDQIIYSNNK